MDLSQSNPVQYWDRIIVGIFVVAISFPLLFSFFSGNSRVSMTENRSLAPSPQLPRDVPGLKAFPQAFERYFNDHFGLREQFVSVNSRLKRLLNDSPSENVILGKEGWLFLKGSAYMSPIRDYQNIDLFTQLELKAYGAAIAKKYHWLKARGIAYLYVVAPNKHTIYEEMLPSYIRKTNPDSAQDQLMAYLKRHTQVPVLDLRHALLARKASSAIPSYEKFDTHWNGYGANIAQYGILKQVDHLLPGKIRPYLYPDTDFQMVDSRFGDLARMMGDMEAYIRGYQVPRLMALLTRPSQVIGEIGPLDHVITCDSGKLSALIYRDSFFGQLQPYVTPYFKRAKYITRYRPTISDIQRELKEASYDIVIEELVERVLPVKLNPFENIGSVWADKAPPAGDTIYDLKQTALMTVKTNELDLTPGQEKASGFKAISTGNDPHLTLTGLKFTPQKSHVIDIHIWSGHKTYLQFFWTSGNRTGQFTEAQSFRQPIEKGENHLYFLLENTQLDPSLRIDFGEETGRFTLEKLKIMALDNPNSDK